MINLLGKTTPEIVELIRHHADADYRGRQVANWVHHRDAGDFGDMSNLPKDMRTRLREEFVLHEPKPLEKVASGDGSTKVLFEYADGVAVESVLMPEGVKATLCLSSQAGCAVGCTFCVTGALGAGRNLTAAEIVGQYRSLRRMLEPDIERVNLVFMGMGEPLLNTAHLGQALRVLYETVSPKRITVSTAGIIPGIRWLAGQEKRPKLALSLNAPDQERREEIMPINRQYPLEDLLKVVREFPLERGRRITFEYVMIARFNDGEDDASMVADLIRGIPSKVNVIPLNEDPVHFPDLRQPTEEVVDAFAKKLRDRGLVVTVRWSKGADVAAACGQLKGRPRPR